MLHLIHPLLRQREVEKDRIHRLQIDDRAARGDELPQIRFADAEGAVEGRADDFLRNQRTLRFNLRECRGGIGDALLDIGQRHEFLLTQLTPAVALRHRKFRGGFQRMQCGFFIGCVQAHQHGPRANPLTRLEQDFADHAAGLGGDIGPVDRNERAYRFGAVPPAFRLRQRNADRRRWLRHVVEEFVHPGVHHRLDGEHAAEDHDRAYQHPCHPLFRGRFPWRCAGRIAAGRIVAVGHGETSERSAVTAVGVMGVRSGCGPGLLKMSLHRRVLSASSAVSSAGLNRGCQP